MSRKPSEATQLRNALRELAEIKRERVALRLDLARAKGQLEIVRSDRDEWKTRFDALLKIADRWPERRAPEGQPR